MSYLLHIDTSADVATVALAAEGRLLATATNADNRNFAASINIMNNEVLAEAGITLKQIDGVAVCAGPGSYTGLRIGLAHAKALCYALDKPLLMHDKLTLLANQEHKKNKTCEVYTAILKAREGEYFISSYNADFECIVSPQLVLQNELGISIPPSKRTLYIGDIPVEIAEINSEMAALVHTTTLDIDFWGAYAFSQFQQHLFADLPYAEPFYLKAVYTHK